MDIDKRAKREETRENEADRDKIAGRNAVIEALRSGREIDRILVDELSNQADDDKLLLEDMKLDLYQSCFEEIVLNLPIKHLCNDSCKGICPSCGKNLNDGLCACSEE